MTTDDQGWTKMACRRTMIALIAAAALVLATPSVALAKKPPTSDPYIESLSTYAAPSGASVTISGANFGDSKTSSTVTFNGAKAKVADWSDTQIVATVPAKATPGYVGVEVGGVSSNGMYFVPAEPPAISAVDTSSAPVGTSVTIVGQGFGTAQGTGSVTFSGVSAKVAAWSDTKIVAVVPSAPSGYLGVWQSTLCSNGIWFVPGGTPSISGLSSPVSVIGDVVTVEGQNFGAAPDSDSLITLAGQPVTPDSWSDKAIKFKVPKGSKTGYVGVWNGGTCSNGAFLVVGPRIDALTSWWGEPGSLLTVTGEGFGLTPDRVTLAGSDLKIVSWSDTEIVADLPLIATEGYVGVWVGEGCSNGIWFLGIAQPVIGSVDSTSVVAGQTLTVTGHAFDARTSYSQVTIGGVDLQIVSWSPTQIVATVPPGISSGYLGVWKKGVASNGVWIDVAH